jgi:uncharacterized protein YndB with AHSA1/START domain
MTIAPVRHAVSVKVAPQRAFDIFTEKFGAWWPGAGIGPTPRKTIVIEPRAEGRWYELSEAGAETSWGKVLAWEPPKRLLLAWQIGADWRFDPGLVTELEITFAGQPDGSTRVELEHRNLERFGPKATAMRAMIGAPDGWAKKLEAFGAFASQAKKAA